MVQYVATFVDLAALDRGRIAGMLLYRRAQCLAAIQNVQARIAEIEPAPPGRPVIRRPLSRFQ
jgi:hypothetical protein